MLPNTSADGPTPEKLRTIATMLDLMDVVLSKIQVGDQQGSEFVAKLKSLQGGTDMQTDLRSWAFQLEARPPCIDDECPGHVDLKRDLTDGQEYVCDTCERVIYWNGEQGFNA